MVFDVPYYWDVAIDGVQVSLCLLILVVLFRLRKRKKTNLPDGIDNDSRPTFNEQVIIQSLQQRVDQSMAAIAETIAVEQRKLDRWLASLNLCSLQVGYPHSQPRERRSADGEIRTIASDVGGVDQVHEQIQSLADQGMSARQISEKLKAPLGEVELVLSLGTQAGK